jgi:hypothetical protein
LGIGGPHRGGAGLFALVANRAVTPSSKLAAAVLDHDEDVEAAEEGGPPPDARLAVGIG